MNRRNVNLLEIVPKHEVLNSKNLNIITRLEAKKEGNTTLNKTPQIKPIRKYIRNLDPQKERKIKKNNVVLFDDITEE